MGKVSMGVIPLAFLMALTAIVVAPAMANLVPASFGFPVIVHSGQSFSFNNDMASSTDSETMDIDFSLFDGMMSPSGTQEIQGASMNNWAMQGMAMPDLSHMAKLFDFPGFNFL